MKFMKENRIAPDGTSHFAASHLGLFCLPVSHKKDARLIWVITIFMNLQSLLLKGDFCLNKSNFAAKTDQTDSWT